ncbi:DUF418 domain-containing protein [Nocardiopsis potens]|uniref:DUF418 domain-containing protein n=1 Tax=Nocardiopsis potens TaxID=1246458 RepID=UPI000379FD24|nr:DUF418 domain-containing protein [Nocardiopsis potens]
MAGTDRIGERRPGPVPEGERALAPDLARGAMLLLIAVANAAGLFLGAAPGVERDPEGAERVFNLLMIALVHARAYPLFALMFGYGVVQLARRLEAATGSPAAARAVLLRRNAWLLLFGLVHAALLFAGDVLGAYGVAGIAFTLLLLHRSDRVYRIVLWYWGLSAVYSAVLLGLAVHGLAAGSGERAPLPLLGSGSDTAPDYLSSVAARLSEWPLHTLYMSGFVLVVWLGAWAARRRVLEEPARHVRLLRTAAAGGLAIGIAGGLPMGLYAAGWLDADAGTAALLKQLYQVSGMFGGVGYAALFGLAALALEGRRRGVAVQALTALGRRSLSGYLVQSAAWLVLTAPYLLALGERSSSPALASLGWAVGVWSATLAAAYAMQRRSLRGPAEVLLRRLSYGRR